MANTSLVICGDSSGISVTSGNFVSISGSIISTTPESSCQTVVRSAGTYKNEFVRTNSVGSGVVTFRKNAANGNQTITAAGAGTYQDTTHTDATVAGDKIDWAVSSVTIVICTVSCLFDSTTNFAVRLNATGSLASAVSAAQTLEPGLIASALSEGSKGIHRVSATLKNLQCILTANAKTSSATYISRKNSANGNMTMTIPASPSGTGIFEDTTHTDSVVATDITIDEFPVGTDITDSLTCTLSSYDFTTSGSNYFNMFVSSNANQSMTISSTKWGVIGGRLTLSGTESNAQTNALAAFSFSNFSVFQSTASGNTITVQFRKNTANGNQVITSGTASANYTDSTHTDSTVASDPIDISYTTGAGTQGSFSIQEVWGNFSAGVLNTRTVSDTSSGTVTEAVNPDGIYRRTLSQANGSVTEALDPTGTYHRTLSETDGSATSTTQKGGTHKPAIQSLGSVTESLGKVGTLHRILSESDGSATSVTAKRAGKAISQADGSDTESILRTRKFVKSISETDGSATSTTVKRAILKPATQALGTVTETIAKIATLHRTVSESDGTDTQIIVKKSIRTVAQALGAVTETIAKVGTLHRTISDSDGVDTSTTAKRATHATSQSIGSVTQTIAKITTLHRTISETDGTDTSSTAKKAIKAVSQAVGTVTETAAKLSSLHRTISDSDGTDTEAIRKTRSHGIAQTLGSVTEVAAKIVILHRTILAANGSGVESTVKHVTHAISQANGTALESIAKAIAFRRTVADNDGSATSTTKKKAVHPLAQALGSVTETVSKGGAQVRVVSETIGTVVESLKKKPTHAISQAIGSVTESAKKTSIRSLTQALGTVTSVTTKKSVMKTIQESLGVIASTTLKKALLKPATQSLGAIVDSVTKGGAVIRNISQSISFGGEAIKKSTSKIVANVLGAVTDVRQLVKKPKIATSVTSSSSTTAIRVVRTVSIETVSVPSGSVARHGTFFRSGSGTSAISESIVRTVRKVRTVSTASVSVSDGPLTRFYKAIRSATQTVSISDSTSKIGKRFKAVTGSVFISESLHVGLGNFKFITEASIPISPGAIILHGKYSRQLLEILPIVGDLVRISVLRKEGTIVIQDSANIGPEFITAHRLGTWIIAGTARSPPISSWSTPIDLVLAETLERNWGLNEDPDFSQIFNDRDPAFGNDWWSESNDCEVHARYIDTLVKARNIGFGGMTEYIAKVDLHFFVRSLQPRVMLADSRMQLMVEESERIIQQFSDKLLPGIVQVSFDNAKDQTDESNVETVEHRIVSCYLTYYRVLIYP